MQPHLKAQPARPSSQPADAPRGQRLLEQAFPAGRRVDGAWGWGWQIEDGTQVVTLRMVQPGEAGLRRELVEILRADDRLVIEDAERLLQAKVESTMLGLLRGMIRTTPAISLRAEPDGRTLTITSEPVTMHLPLEPLHTEPARRLIATAAELIRAYPSRPATMSANAFPSRACRELRQLAEHAAAELVPGPDWLGDASVGQGTWAVVPWVGFFDRRLTTRATQGVYPAIQLLWKGAPGLRLGLNVSVTEFENGGADLPERVQDELAEEDRRALLERGFGAGDLDLAGLDHRLPRSYARRMVFEKVVPIDEVEARQDELVEDLRVLLRSYRDWVESGLQRHAFSPASSYQQIHELGAAVDALVNAASRRGLVYPRPLLESLFLSLKCKPFCLLAGPTGTGKSRLARLLGDIGLDVRLEPVDPAWRDAESLIGTWEGGKLELGLLASHAQRAERQPDRYHVLVLDELNLAQVEHYMAHWLSVLESRRIEVGRVVADPLFSERGYHVPLPENLGVIGTVNLDGANPQLSQRVLDRVNVLLLHSPTTLLDTTPSPLGDGPGALATVSPAVFATRALTWDEVRDGVEASRWGDVFEATFREVWQPTQDALAHHRSHMRISYRLRDEIAAYLLHGRQAGLAPQAPSALIDQQLCQRVLPRLCDGSPLKAELVEELLRLWSPHDSEAFGAATLLKAVWERQREGLPASLWDALA